MAGEIYSTYPEGSTLYAVVRRQSDGYVNINGGNTFEAWVDANFLNGDYDITLTDGDGNYYFADFPTTITTEDKYVVYIFVQVGGVPADGDWVLSQAWFGWDGTAEITIIEISEGLVQASNIFEDEEADEGARIINL